MGFMSRYSGTDTIDVTDLGPDDGVDYWVEVKKTLTGDEWDRADAVQVQASASVTAKSGRGARAAAARRRGGRGQGPKDDEGEMATLLRFDNPAYRHMVLELGIVAWNLNDEFDRPLPLETPEGRAASIAGLPPQLRKRLFEHLEAAKADRDPDEDADFPERLPAGGPGAHDAAPADPGVVAQGGVVDAYWADDRAGMGDLQSA